MLCHVFWHGYEIARLDELRRGRITILEFVIAIGAHRAMVGGSSHGYRTLPCYVDECPRAGDAKP